MSFGSWVVLGSEREGGIASGTRLSSPIYLSSWQESSMSSQNCYFLLVLPLLLSRPFDLDEDNRAINAY